MRFAILLMAPVLAGAAIWPDTLGPYHRASTSRPAVTDQALWNEYGLKESESAKYENGTDAFTATAYRLQDSTGALAAYDWQRPATAKPATGVSGRAVETPKDLMLLHGSYVLSFQGYKPTSAELQPLLDGLKNVDGTPLPTLEGFMPTADLNPNSERYVIGPVGLAKFDPGIPPSVAAFHLGAEAQLGVFHSPKGDMTLAVFNYPTNQMAMQKEGDFRKLGGAVVKRSGPLIAVVAPAPDPDAAERLLGLVRYDAQVTLDERVPKASDNPGVMLVNIFVLTGILLAFCIVAGLFVGGFRTFLLRGRKGREAEPMILLHLDEHTSR